MREDGYRSLKISYIIFTVITALGASIGAICFSKIYGGSDEIRDYLDKFTEMLSGADKTAVIMRQFKMSAFFVGICIICSFAKIGIVPIAAVTARSGFIYGFSNAALIASYGGTGVLLALSRLPELAVTVTAIILCGSVCAAMAYGKITKDRNSILLYALFIIIICTAFSVGALFEGFFSTSLMRIIMIRFA